MVIPASARGLAHETWAVTVAMATDSIRIVIEIGVRHTAASSDLGPAAFDLAATNARLAKLANHRDRTQEATRGGSARTGRGR